MYRTDFGTLWEKARVGCSERIALKQVYYQGWNRSPVQVGCMRQGLRADVLGRPRGIGWGGRQEGVSGLGTHVNPWFIHVNVWQKPLQYCKVIILQVIKINEKKKKLEWVVMTSSMGSSQLSDLTHFSYVSCIGRRFFTTSLTWEAWILFRKQVNIHYLDE